VSFISIKAEVVVRGRISSGIHINDLYYAVPINGVGNIIYDQRKVNFVNDSVFLIRTVLKYAGFIYLMMPEKIISFYVNPDDSVGLSIVYEFDKDHKGIVFKTLNFSGPNSSGNEIFNLNPSYSQLINFQVNIFLNKYETIQAFYKASLLSLNKLLYPLDSLYTIHKIDSGFYHVVSKEIQGSFIYSFFGLFSFLSRDNNMKIHDKFILAKETNQDILTQSNYDTLKYKFYQDFNPMDSDYQYTVLGKGFTCIYCMDMYDGNFKKTAAYDSAFLTLDPSLRYLGYMKGKLLEAVWAGELYLKAMSESDHELNTNYKLFVKHFPVSPYKKLIEKRLKDFGNDKSSSLTSKEVIFRSENNSIKQVVSKNFQNQFVLIDLWATWCSPCIYEFKYKDRTKAFLDKNKIKLLYISIDKISEESHWKKFAAKNKLLGTHILASENMRGEISKIFYENKDILIPRYVLIDKQGKIVGDDLPVPSSGEKFETKILSLIRNK
jgi:thiol-disulfide isomerase/thioredoxin